MDRSCEQHSFKVFAQQLIQVYVFTHHRLGPMKSQELLRLPWTCPTCHKPLAVDGDGLRCSDCNQSFAIEKGCLRFISDSHNSTIQKFPFDIKLRNFYKRWPSLYYFVATFFGPTMFTGLSAHAFARRSGDAGICLNLGSGPRRLNDRIINVDLFNYHGVDVQASVDAVPLASASVDAIICDELVEHMAYPERLLDEVHRLLKPGGRAYFTAVFVYPYHSSPIDMTRWTRQGFVKMLERSGLKVEEAKVRAGGFSALATLLCYLFALVFSFNSKRMFWILMNLSIFVFFPIKLLDLIFARMPIAENMASVLYYVVRKS